MKNSFEKVKLHQLYHLCRSVVESNIYQRSYIEHKYSEYGLKFDETLAFAGRIGLLKINSDELTPVQHLSNHILSLVEFKQFVIQKIFSANSEITNKLNQFLTNFQFKEDKYIFNATPIEKLKYSDIRNILLEVDFITTTDDKNSYVLNNNYRALFTQVVTPEKVTANKFKSAQEAKNKLGFDAEEEILEYEKKRLSNTIINTNDIEHTSQENVFAGYDIKSYENYLDQNLNRIIRYIEVKAVSVYDYKFFWSKNEIDFSYIQRERYYLYLLPVKGKGTFDTENIKIISDPYLNVFNNGNDWFKEIESYSFGSSLKC